MLLSVATRTSPRSLKSPEKIVIRYRVSATNCVCVDVVYVLSEYHSSVIGHSKCGGGVGVLDQLTVQRDGRL